MLWVTGLAVVCAAGAVLVGGCPATTTDSSLNNQVQAVQAALSTAVGTNTAATAVADANATVDPNGGHWGPPRPPRGPQLNLTDEQKAAAKALHQQARQDIAALKLDAYNQMRAVLTADQQAIFDTLLPPPPDPNDPNAPPDGGPGCPPPPPDPNDPNAPPPPPPWDPNDPNAPPPPPPGGGPGGPGGPHGGPGGPGGFGPGGPGGHGGPGGRGKGFGPGGPGGGPGPDVLLPMLTVALDLTTDQQTEIETILTTTGDAIAARHEQVRTDFRALLTAEQLAILDQWEADHPRPTPPA